MDLTNGYRKLIRELNESMNQSDLDQTMQLLEQKAKERLISEQYERDNREWYRLLDENGRKHDLNKLGHEIDKAMNPWNEDSAL